MKNLKVLLLLAVFLSTWGCSDQGKPAGISTSELQQKSVDTGSPAIKVSLIMKTLTNPFFIEMEKGARKAQQESGIDLRVRTATQETSIEQQIQLVEQEIEAKVQAIVIAPGDSARLVPALKKAQDAGIHIVNIDNRLSAEALQLNAAKPVPFISVDNEEGAYQATRVIADKAPQNSQAAVIEGIRTADNAQQRKRGAERAFKANPNIRLVAEETANWKIDEAYLVARNLFKAHPKINLVFCANDMMAIGVIKYLQESGRKQVQVASFDALEEARTAVRAGLLASTVNQQADQQGYLGVKTALKLLKGETVPMEQMVKAEVLTAGDLK